MSVVPPFSKEQIESLSQILGDCGSGSEISHALVNCGMEDNSGLSTKWRRLNWIFLESQDHYNCSNQILNFISSFLNPVRFINKKEVFEDYREKLNLILAFSGLKYCSNGNFKSCEAAETIDEAEMRVKTIQAKFRGRSLHPEVVKYCRAELMQDNYFHAVFEASKGLAQRIRVLSNIEGDGAQLVDKVFSVDRPVLIINSLKTETERSEHKGFATLLKGCFATVRNPLAHEPKILWDGEDDAADYFSLISLLHRKLDDCVLTRLGENE